MTQTTNHLNPDALSAFMGFNKGANPDVTGTLQKAIDRINALPKDMRAPDLLIHTGDITQNSKPQEFDTAVQVIKGAKVGQVFTFRGSTTIRSMTALSTGNTLAMGHWAMAGTALSRIALTRIPLCPNSTARARVDAMTAPLSQRMHCARELPAVN